MTSASVRPPALRKPKDSQDKEKERGRDKERQSKEKERGRDKERRQDKEKGREKERHQGKGHKKRKAQPEDTKGKAVVELMAAAKKSKKEKEKKTVKVGKGESEAVETRTAEEKKKVEDSKKAETDVAKKSRAEKKKAKKAAKKEAGKEKETGEEQKEGGDKKDTKRKKSPEPKVKFVPARAPKIEHIFETPERKKPGEMSPLANASVSGSSSRLTSKQKAEQKLQELTALLNSSDGESSSCPATDLEELLGGESESGETGSQDSSDEETNQKEETKAENKEKESQKSKEEEEVDDSLSSEEQESSEEEEESEDEEKSCEEDLEESKKDTQPATEAATPPTAAEATAAHPDSHALVPVTKKTAETAVALRNSMTDKAAWDAFNRNARSKMPHSLADHYAANKTELFNLWLEADRDWTKVELSAERIQQQKSISSRGYEAVQGKVLRKRYDDEAKYKAVIAARRQSGMFYEDDDFPDDEEECWYFVKQGQKFTRKDETGDTLKMKAKTDVDPTLRAALLDSDTGLMRAGALPKVSAANAAGAKAVLDGIEKVVAAPKKKAKPGKEGSEPAEPETWAKKAASCLPVISKDASDARTASIKLGGMEYASELATQLLEHATKMEAAADAFLKPKKAKAKGKSKKKKDSK